MTFTGWPPAATAFFEGLEQDNSRQYWQAHQATYQRDVKGPMVALLSALRGEFGPGRLLRPTRDIRFSQDKSPYRTAIGATISDAYVELTARGLKVGVGRYDMPTDQLGRYRQAVLGNGSGTALEGLVDSLRDHGLEVRGTDCLKTAPRGVPRDHPRIELLRYRGIVAMKNWPVAAWISTPGAGQRIAQVLRDAQPLARWLEVNVGPPEG